MSRSENKATRYFRSASCLLLERTRGEHSSHPTLRDTRRVREKELRATGIAVVKLDGQVFHLLAGLNADQYAAEMRGQFAGPVTSEVAIGKGAAVT